MRSGGRLSGGNQTLSPVPGGATLLLTLRILVALNLFGAAMARSEDASATFLQGLTAAQRDWLARNPVIRFGADPNWPPYSLRTGEELEGVDPDYLDLLGKRLGVRFEYVPSTSWEDTLQKLRRLEIDVATGVADLPERPLGLLYTRPYTSFPVTLIMRSDSPFHTSLEQIRDANLTMAGPTGYAPTIFLKRNFPEIRIVSTRNSAEAMHLVSSGRVDAALENLGVAAHQIRLHGLGNLKISGAIAERFDPAMAVREDSVELHAILDAAIESISQAERHAILEKWVLVEISGLWSGGRVRLLGTILLLLFAAALLYTTLRILKLQRELRRRRLEEDLLRRGEERFRRFFETLDSPVFLTHLDGRIQFLSDPASVILKIDTRHVVERLNLRTFLARTGDFDDLLADVRSKGVVVDRKIQFIDAGGGPCACICTVRLLTDREGVEVGIEWMARCDDAASGP